MLKSCLLFLAAALVFHLASPVPAPASPAIEPAASAPIAKSLSQKKTATPAVSSTPNNTETQPAGSSREIAIPSGLRAIVFSPHPDDETLGVGGLIQHIVKNEGKVLVVFVTNGDGYLEGIRGSGKSAANRAAFVEYGRLRHDEAIQAVCELGLGNKDAVFLGFPDSGIDDLWAANWSMLRPFTSPFTHCSQPPYLQCFSRIAKYAGLELRNEMAAIIRDFMPDWVIIPDPRDFHPDHYTTGVFVLDALKKLDDDSEISFDAIKICTYLVHYGGYPESPNWVEDVNRKGIGGSEAEDDLLAETDWQRFSMTAAEWAGKQRALNAHQSQFKALGHFFKSFTRPPYEYFGFIEPSRALAIAVEYAFLFKKFRAVEPATAKASIQSP